MNDIIGFMANTIYAIVDGSGDTLHYKMKITSIADWLRFGDYDSDACDNVYDLAQAWTEYDESVK